MKSVTAHILLFCGNFIWACAYPLYKMVLNTHIEPLALYTLTMIFTALVSLTSLGWDSHRRNGKGAKEHHIERDDIFKVILAALLIAVIRKEMLMFGLSMTSPIDGSIIATLTPVAVLILSVILRLERFSKYKLIGVLLGMAGAIGIILSGSSKGDASHIGSTQMWGNIMIMCCAFISAIYMVWFKTLLQKYDPVTLLRWIFCIAAILIIPIGFKSVVHTDFASFNTKTWLAVGYLIVLPTYLPNLLLTTALRSVTPTITSIYTYVQPVVAVGLSIAFGLDKLNFDTLLFGLILLSGVSLVLFSPKNVA